MEGKTPCGIARYLTENGIKTVTGKLIWNSSTVESVLGNVKYKGDAILQRYYSESFLTKRQLVNNGQIPQYYIADNHTAIVDPVVFDMVQQEMKRRKEDSGRHSGTSIFAGKIICGQCGSVFGAKVWHSTDKYRRVIYQCNNKYKGQKRCTTPHLSETDIKSLFVSTVNKLLADKERIIAGFDDIKGTVFDTSALDSEADRLRDEIAVLAVKVQECIDENAHSALNQDEYRARYGGLVMAYEDVKARLDGIEAQRQDKLKRQQHMEAFLAELRNQDGLIVEFDERLWCALVGNVMVYGDRGVKIKFRNEKDVSLVIP